MTYETDHFLTNYTSILYKLPYKETLTFSFMALGKEKRCFKRALKPSKIICPSSKNITIKYISAADATVIPRQTAMPLFMAHHRHTANRYNNMNPFFKRCGIRCLYLPECEKADDRPCETFQKQNRLCK